MSRIEKILALIADRSPLVREQVANQLKGKHCG